MTPISRRIVSISKFLLIFITILTIPGCSKSPTEYDPIPKSTEPVEKATYSNVKELKMGDTWFISYIINKPAGFKAGIVFTRDDGVEEIFYECYGSLGPVIITHHEQLSQSEWLYLFGKGHIITKATLLIKWVDNYFVSPICVFANGGNMRDILRGEADHTDVLDLNWNIIE